MALTPNSNRTKTVPLWMSSTVPAYLPCTRHFFKIFFAGVCLPRSLHLPGLESVSGCISFYAQNTYQNVFPYLEYVPWHHQASRRTDLWQGMEVSTPKISARTTFSATAMTLACTIRSSWTFVCPEDVLIQIEDLAFLQHGFFAAGNDAAWIWYPIL